MTFPTRLIVLGLALAGLASQCHAQERTAAELSAEFTTRIQPLLVRYCHECHSAERMEAELNLAAFTTLDQVRRHAATWQKAREMLDTAQMPPKDARQPSDAERRLLQTWVREMLTREAAAHAGDPGRVVLRRLSNSEYTYTVRDLTGLPELDPAREFPVDGAAGEGFTNTGNALVMSPALLVKYLDAAKGIAQHAVLLPDGMRFSPQVTPSDWTNETLAEIRGLYRKHSDSGGASRVNLQGIVFDTNDGGRLAVERYLAATLEERDALTAGRKTFAQVAAERNLNAKYLERLWTKLNDNAPSLVLDALRKRWRETRPDQLTDLTTEVALWQKGLWRFSSVGHIGKVGGPTAWQEPVTPLTSQQEIRLKFPADSKPGSVVSVFLVATDAGDGSAQDVAVWDKPRLVAPGRPDLPLRDLRAVYQKLLERREQLVQSAARCLDAVSMAARAENAPDLAALAASAQVEPELLKAWLDYVGVGTGSAAAIQSHFQPKFTSPTYAFIQGWGPAETPNVVANSSDQHVRIPGNMRPHSIAMHPSPTLNVLAGWRSPVAARVRVSGRVQHAHPECGNGVTWVLEVRRGNTRTRLASGIAHGPREVAVGPVDKVLVKTGDVISFAIGPRDGNHSCDLTAVDLTIQSDDKEWDLARDVSPSILAANPHADSHGNAGVWNFYTEPVSGDAGVVIPPSSLLSRWLAADGVERTRLAQEIQQLMTGKAVPAEGPDTQLYQQLTALNGPLLAQFLKNPAPASSPATGTEVLGLDPATFGKHPEGGPADPQSLIVSAPSVLEVRLPADLIQGCEFVTTAKLDPRAGAEGSVQLMCLTSAPANLGLVPPHVAETQTAGPWTSNTRGVSYSVPILVQDQSAARKRIEQALTEFRDLFPAALCYTKIVPVDEVVTLTLYYREDHHLARLMLNDAEQRELDRLWDQLHFVSRDALTLVDAYAQLMEYATQDADPKVFEPLRQPIQARAAAFRKQLVDSEPSHLNAVLRFAGQAYRRPLEDAEGAELRALYARLRQEGIPHEDAIRLTLARVLVSPAFLYKVERPAQADRDTPVSDFELASRLSYFLWSSQPDEELRSLAAAGKLHEPDVLRAQAKRMLKDPRTRRLAVEFGCQWLHIRDFDRLDEKSERHFPTFKALRSAMYEESILFFTDLFQNNGTVASLLAADHTFLNEDLAKHYGIPDVTGPHWRRVEGIRRQGRGGILAQATTLATQSGASRTSPILRGNWISEVLLGERLPRPPKDVPQLPDDEAATAGLTVRQLVERHSSDPRCAVCHQRIDPMGFSLEQFDAIGRRRETDLAGRTVETRVKTMEGIEFTGLDGLRDYLQTVRGEGFSRQFCKKLLGYSLGRSVQLSDEPLLNTMQQTLREQNDHVWPLIEVIVTSRQFREIRGRNSASDE